MVIVLASTRVKEGRRDEFVKAFKDFAETVRKEKGCIEYFPAIDLKSGFPPQVLDKNVVTIIEKWESMQALQDHLQTPQMKAFGEKSNAMVEDMSVKVLQPA